MKLIIDTPTPSLNETIRVHWGKRRRQKELWAWMIKVAIGKQKKEIYNHVTITRYGARKLDYDNLAGGAKSVVTDNLVMLGLLKDDNPDDLEMVFKQVSGKGAMPHRTEIELNSECN